MNAVNEACPVEMSDERTCGRSIHIAPMDYDKLPVCLMHSRDPTKPNSKFMKEIEYILSDSSEQHRHKGTFDFTGFVFPDCFSWNKMFT